LEVVGVENAKKIQILNLSAVDNYLLGLFLVVGKSGVDGEIYGFFGHWLVSSVD
jgi:hypothetical protein